MTGSKKINHIFIRHAFAYLSADYGVIVFDLKRLQVKETWRDLGMAESVKNFAKHILMVTVFFWQLRNGVIAGDLKDNLQDFNNWKRFESGEFNGPVQSVSTFNGTIYSAINTQVFISTRMAFG